MDCATDLTDCGDIIAPLCHRARTPPKAQPKVAPHVPILCQGAAVILSREWSDKLNWRTQQFGYKLNSRSRKRTSDTSGRRPRDMAEVGRKGVPYGFPFALDQTIMRMLGPHTVGCVLGDPWRSVVQGCRNHTHLTTPLWHSGVVAYWHSDKINLYEHCGWFACAALDGFPPLLQPKTLNLSLKLFVSLLDRTLWCLCLDPP